MMIKQKLYDVACYGEECHIEDMLHKTIKEIKQIDNYEIWFLTTDNYLFEMYHCQNCCERVEIEDICGDLDDLIGAQIAVAEERTNDGGYNDYGNSCTWTFYELKTFNGDVTIRWYGTSNGYYSERADMRFFTPDEVSKAGITSLHKL